MENIKVNENENLEKKIIEEIVNDTGEKLNNIQKGIQERIGNFKENTKNSINECMESLELNPFRVGIINICTYAERLRQFVSGVEKVKLSEYFVGKQMYDYTNYLKTYVDGINKIINQLEENLRQFYMEPEDIYDLLNTKERFKNEMNRVIQLEKALSLKLYTIIVSIGKEETVPVYYNEFCEYYNQMNFLFEEINTQAINTCSCDYKGLK